MQESRIKRQFSLHPNTQRALEWLKAEGQYDAGIILELVKRAERWLESVKDLHQVLGLVGDIDDVLNGAVDSAYEELFPPLLKRAGAFGELYWHITPMMLIEAHVHFYLRVDDHLPSTVWLNYRWGASMRYVDHVEIEGQKVRVKYLKKLPGTAGQPIGGDRWAMLTVWSDDSFEEDEPPADYLATKEDFDALLAEEEE